MEKEVVHLEFCLSFDNTVQRGIQIAGERERVPWKDGSIRSNGLFVYQYWHGLVGQLTHG